MTKAERIEEILAARPELTREHVEAATAAEVKEMHSLLSTTPGTEDEKPVRKYSPERANLEKEFRRVEAKRIQTEADQQIADVMAGKTPLSDDVQAQIDYQMEERAQKRAGTYSTWKNIEANKKKAEADRLQKQKDQVGIRQKKIIEAREAFAAKEKARKEGKDEDSKSVNDVIADQRAAEIKAMEKNAQKSKIKKKK